MTTSGRADAVLFGATSATCLPVGTTRRPAMLGRLANAIERPQVDGDPGLHFELTTVPIRCALPAQLDSHQLPTLHVVGTSAVSLVAIEPDVGVLVSWTLIRHHPGGVRSISDDAWSTLIEERGTAVNANRWRASATETATAYLESVETLRSDPARLALDLIAQRDVAALRRSFADFAASPVDGAASASSGFAIIFGGPLGEDATIVSDLPSGRHLRLLRYRPAEESVDHERIARSVAELTGRELLLSVVDRRVTGLRHDLERLTFESTISPKDLADALARRREVEGLLRVVRTHPEGLEERIASATEALAQINDLRSDVMAILMARSVASTSG